MTALPVACDPTPVASTPRLVVVPRHRLHGDADLPTSRRVRST